MLEAADRPETPKRARSLTGFYVAVGVLMALTLFGAWFWTAWNNWWFAAAEAQRRQAGAAARLGLPVEKAVDLGGGVKLELVLIPAGRFRMGDQSGRGKEDGYQWVQITKPFYIGKYEVTQEEWEKVMGSNPSYFKGAKNPVEDVSWNDCQEFLKKLNQLSPHPAPLPAGEGVSHSIPSPTGRGSEGEGSFRLPTEAEWEWACRAGTRTRFCSGDDGGALGDYAWYDANEGDTTHPVGEKKPNAWGLYDCHGNVWEWCGDWWDEYSHGCWPKADPTGPATGAGRVLRGGSWFLFAGFCQSAHRAPILPSYCDHYFVGFRVVGSSSKIP